MIYSLYEERKLLLLSCIAVLKVKYVLTYITIFGMIN